MLSFFDVEKIKLLNKEECNFSKKENNYLKNLENYLSFNLAVDVKKFKSISFNNDFSIDNINEFISRFGWKLQGTDGVRAISENNSSKDREALSLFIKDKKITPGFCFNYTLAILKLFEINNINLSKIFIGEDGRELLVNAGLKRSITKALLIKNVVVEDLKVVPTPLLAASSLMNDTLAIMITASHNPASYNGIKVFYKGKKLYPFGVLGEYNLSKIFLDFIFGNICYNYSILGKLKDSSDYAKIIFNKIFSNIDKDKLLKNLENKILLIDSANGAYSEYIINYLNNIKTIEYKEIACDLGTTLINEKSGVALLENLPLEINYDNNYPPSIMSLFNIGRESKKKVFMIVLDGDGDRCFLLEYKTETDSILILNGDQLAYSLSSQTNNGQLTTTIESDFELCRSIKINYKIDAKITCVGDRWLTYQLEKVTPQFIGTERSGHIISPHIIDEKPLLTGNGFYTALKVLSNKIETFEPGFNNKISIMGYPLDLFYRDSKNWFEIKKLIETEFIKFKLLERKFNNEIDLLYFDIFDFMKIQIGWIYVRKSGTEPKLSIGISSIKNQKKYLREIINNLEFNIKDFT